jgi:hypothetical protein
MAAFDFTGVSFPFHTGLGSLVALPWLRHEVLPTTDYVPRRFSLGAVKKQIEQVLLCAIVAE